MYSDKTTESSKAEGYLPFKGWTAWFSASVESSYKSYWEKYGGRYGDEYSADFIFSKDAAAKDTFTIHRDQINVSVFKPDWIVVVVKKRAGLSSVPIGQYFLSPFSAPSMKVKTTDEVLLPVVPEVKLVESKSEHLKEDQEELGFLHIDQLPMPKGLVFEFIAKQNGCAVKKRETKKQ